MKGGDVEVKIGLPNRKSRLDRLADTAAGAADEVSGRLQKQNIVKAGLIAGGLAALTAASAGISSLRRRQEGAGNHGS